MSNYHYNVAPRYTPGSPAMVDAATAERVAASEKAHIGYILECYEGERAADRAKRLGLRGIAERRIEKGSGKKQGWEVLDLCTGERFFRLCSEALRKLGWRQYDDLETYERAIVDAEPPQDFEDYKKAMYKLDAPLTAGFPNGWKVRVYRPDKINT